MLTDTRSVVFRSAAALACAIALTLTAVTPAHAAGRTISGKVTCLGSAAPVGIWVDAETGRDGFAKLEYRATAAGVSTVYYSYKMDNGGRYRLNVGCGGTGKKWGMSLSSGWVRSATTNFRCNDINPIALAGLRVVWRLVGKIDLTQGISRGTCKQY